MITKTFRIQWRNPITDEVEETQMTFTGNEEISPELWADDWAYSAAEKGWYAIEEVKS